MKERKPIKDTTLIGSWEEVQNLPLSAITKRDTDTTKLDGLVIRGYETKFSQTNQNGERYAPGCLDKFIQDYFIDNGLNMVVDVQHGYTIDDQVGRVIYLETNTVGFYFVAYVPRSIRRYEQVKELLKEGILQGFSKCGWATDWEYRYTPDGELDYMLINEMSIVSVSLVTSPANAVAFEGFGETIQNRLEYKNTIEDEAKPKKKSLLKSRN